MSNIDKLIETPATILDDARLTPLRFDLVTQVHSYDTIGRRHGLGGEAGLARYLQDNPAFTSEVAKLRAMFTSDLSAQDRARLKATLASEELIPDIYQLVANDKTAAGLRIDAFKQLNRMGGVDGIPAATKNGQSGPGTQFSLTINMPDGRTEKILTTVVDDVSPPPEDEDEADA